MDLVIARSEGIVSIDNQPLAVNTSSLASNIELLAYDCTNGAGNLEYNDRLRVLEPFGDITPYAAFVNSWMTTAAAITAMPLTLAQAKRIKIGLVDGIYNSKRQLPITTQGHTWDATDQSMIGMQAQLAAFNMENQINAVVNASIASLSSSTFQTAPAVASGSAGASSYITGTFLTGVDFAHQDPNSQPKGSMTAVYTVSGSAQITQQPQFATQTSMPTIGLTGPNISWPALNETTPVTLSFGAMRNLINSIQQRRGSLQSTRVAKTNAINTLVTVTAVIAYDATTGWPF